MELACDRQLLIATEVAQDEMVSITDLDGHEFEQTTGDGAKSGAWCAVVREIEKSQQILT